MLESCKSAQERWGGVSELIDAWLEERVQLLVLYCSLTGSGQTEEDRRPIQEKIRSLCEILVDYISAGHFEIYEQLQQEAIAFRDSKAIERSKELIPLIQKTTDACISFNDKADCFSNITDLQMGLSKLGEVLEERFFLEDKMIEILHNAHKEITQQSEVKSKF